VKIKFHDGKIRKLMGVRHIPNLSKNLISLGFLEEKGCKFQSDGGVLRVSKRALTIMRGKRNLYFLQGSTVTSSVSVASSDPTSDVDVTKLWHMRLGHMSERGMTILCKRGLLCGQCTSSLEFCEHCVFGKQKRLSFSTTIHRTKEMLDYIHSDLWGPSRVPSKGNGSRYMLTFIDDFSRKVWAYFLKEKSEAFKVFKEWKTLLENQIGKRSRG